MLKLPAPRIVARCVDEKRRLALIEKGLPPLLARVLAGRPEPVTGADGVLDPRLALLDSPWALQDMRCAAERVAEAIIHGEVIGLETDHDCDGQTSHAVLFSALHDYFRHPVDGIRSYIGHRLKEGYGLSEALAQRILNDTPQATLLITADNGSTDEPRIAQLKQHGIDTVVTDHHEIPKEGVPKSAYACINPTRKECNYPDPLIAGCMVAWLLMSAVRQVLIEQKHLEADAPKLTGLLDYVAVGTVADCVSMARSHNNRAVVRFGLKRIQQGVRASWRAIQSTLYRPEVRAEDLAFGVGPLLNSDGRLDSAMGSVRFLLSDDDQQAGENVRYLQRQNEERKAIQRKMTARAQQHAQQQVNANRLSIVAFLEEGHAGVHGISASRIKEAWGRPVILFSPKQGHPDVITGSARGIDEMNVRSALEWVDEHFPGVLLGFGGHRGAAGLTIKKTQFPVFFDAFEKAVEQQIKHEDVGPVCLTDGVLRGDELVLETVDALAQIEPCGREFEAPCFQAVAKTLNVKPLGKQGEHARLLLHIDGKQVEAVWFNVGAGGMPVQGQKRLFVFILKENHYRGNKTLQLQIICAGDPLCEST